MNSADFGTILIGLAIYAVVWEVIAPIIGYYFGKPND